MSFDRRKIRTGRVISNKMEKTIVVQLESRYVHRLYRKAVKTRSNIKVHNPENIVVVFDHRVPAKDIISATAQQTGRNFVKKFDIQRFHEI